MELNYNIEGFLQDASFSVHILDFLRKWQDKFPGVEKLMLDIRELHFYALADQNKYKEWFQLSDDVKKLTIVHNYHKWYDQKGKVTGRPEPHNVFFDLTQQLQRAVEKYEAIIQTKSDPE